MLKLQLLKQRVKTKYVKTEYVKSKSVKTKYDAKNISRAFKWPNFAEGFVFEALSRLER